MERRPKVVVALHDRVECDTVARWLDAKGFQPLTRTEMATEAYDLLIAEANFASQESMRSAHGARNTRIPVILVGQDKNASRGPAINGQTMHVARPLDRATLMCFVMMAILDHRPERRSIRKPVGHTDAYVNGLPVRIVDVSNEGLCIVTPSDRATLLPPTFNVRIPMVGVSVAVQRVWGRRAGAGAPTTWYGGTLTQNPPTAAQGWKSFVDTVPIIRGSQLSLSGH
jgi:hypothetical protein